MTASLSQSLETSSCKADDTENPQTHSCVYTALLACCPKYQKLLTWF